MRTAATFAQTGAFLVMWAALGVLGFIVVTSASMEFAAMHFDSPWYFSIRQGAYLGIAALVLLAVRAVPLDYWRRYYGLSFFLSLVTLVLALALRVSQDIEATRHWFDQSQISLYLVEAFKFFFLLYFAAFLTRTPQHLFGKSDVPAVIILVSAALLFMSSSLATGLVLLTTIFAMLFITGFTRRHLLLFAGISALLVVLVAMQFYLLPDFVVLTEITALSDSAPSSASLAALGHGGWFGLGLGNSLLKLQSFSGEQALFPVLVEELGVFGVAILVALFVAVIWRGLWLSWRCFSTSQHFEGLLALAVAWVLGFQALLHISVAIDGGVAIGVFPAVKLSLPLVGYGVNALVVSSAFFGLLLRIEHELSDLDQSHGN